MRRSVDNSMHDSMHSNMHDSMHDGMHRNMHSSMRDSMHKSMNKNMHNNMSDGRSEWPRTKAVELKDEDRAEGVRAEGSEPRGRSVGPKPRGSEPRGQSVGAEPTHTLRRKTREEDQSSRVPEWPSIGNAESKNRRAASSTTGKGVPEQPGIQASKPYTTKNTSIDT